MDNPSLIQLVRLQQVHLIKDEKEMTCKQQDCTNPKYIAGDCRMHYMRKYRARTVETVDQDDLWEFIQQEVKMTKRGLTLAGL